MAETRNSNRLRKMPPVAYISTAPLSSPKPKKIVEVARVASPTPDVKCELDDMDDSHITVQVVEGRPLEFIAGSCGLSPAEEEQQDSPLLDSDLLNKLFPCPEKPEINKELNKSNGNKRKLYLNEVEEGDLIDYKLMEVLGFSTNRSENGHKSTESPSPSISTEDPSLERVLPRINPSSIERAKRRRHFPVHRADYAQAPIVCPKNSGYKINSSMLSQSSSNDVKHTLSDALNNIAHDDTMPSNSLNGNDIGVSNSTVSPINNDHTYDRDRTRESQLNKLGLHNLQKTALLSKIRTEEAMTEYYRLKTQKLRLEIEQLEKNNANS